MDKEINEQEGSYNINEEILRYIAEEATGALGKTITEQIVERMESGSTVEDVFKAFPILKVAFKPSLQKVAEAKIDDTQKIGAALLELTSSYYESARQQSQRSFIFAIIAAAIGLGFFIAAYFTDKTFLSLGSGSLLELLSAIVFTLYTRTSSQLSSFLKSMETTQRYLIANSICESLVGGTREQVRSELVRKIADISVQQESKSLK